MAKVLVFCDAYLPGFKAGGPIPSISRIVDTDPDHQFRIVTRDRDIGEHEPYPSMMPRSWHQVGPVSVAYLRPGLRDTAWVASEIRSWEPDFYYVNSLQSPWFALFPLAEIRTRRLPPARVVLAPRGETSTGARVLKRRKKHLARPLIKSLLGSSVTWHVSSTLEEADVRQWWGNGFPRKHDFIVRADLAVPPADHESAGRSASEPKPVVTFASRIDRMKGLEEAVALMSDIASPFVLRVTGTIKEADYWADCLNLAQLELEPERFRYGGEFTPQDAQRIFAESVLMVLPTKSENFGHVIAEAMSVGCPVLIPDTTPWTPVVVAGGGAILDDACSAREFVELVLTESPVDRLERRKRVLEVYRDWFRQYQDVRTLFSVND